MSQNSKFIHKSHNVTVLLYHLVSSAKYRRVVISDSVDRVLVATCSEIEKRYEVCFLEVGMDKNHVHFLIQSVPSYSVTKIVTMVKSILAKEVFRQCPEVKNQLWV
jgi:REP element-mobilizing transposase RayT